jgi:hypothetical protein
MRNNSPTPATGVTGKKYCYPFLFALYPVLFLYRHNIREVSLARVFPALAVALAIAAVFWLLSGWLVCAPGKRSLLLFLFLLLFHFYGMVYGWIAVLLPDDSLPLLSHAVAFVLPGGLWFFLSWAVVRSARDLRIFNRGLRLAVIFLLAWNVTGILIHHGQSLAGRLRMTRTGNAGAAAKPDRRMVRPDIYLFVLDEFASLESALSLFGYDNSRFAARLRQQGFFVAQGSRSRFHITELAIADILNLGEIDAEKDPYPLIRRNAIAAQLKRRGYRIIEFPLQPAMFMEEADQRFYYSPRQISIFFDDFYRVLFERSLLRILPDRWRRQNPDAARYYRERVLRVFEKLPPLIKSPGPKFIYVHLYCPHEPFVFGARGEATEKSRFWSHADPRSYLQQYMFVSFKIAQTVARILQDSPTAPVIVLLSDHGYRGSRGRTKQGRQVPWDEMFKVFNALYLPGMEPRQIDPQLAPRNDFRLIFNRYFALPLPLFKDPRMLPPAETAH